MVDPDSQDVQCEMLPGFARESTKNVENKKFGECITPTRYNVIHMHCFGALLGQSLSENGELEEKETGMSQPCPSPCDVAVPRGGNTS